MNSKSLKTNILMNFILTATNFIFPLITFPYISRVLGAEGTGAVSFVASVVNYFTMIANLGIPTYGIRVCAQVRDDKNKLSKTVHELFIINSIMTLVSLIVFVLSVYLVPQFREEKALFYINGIGLILNLFGINWLYQALEQYSYITIRSIVLKLVSVFLMFTMVRQGSDYVLYGGISVLAAAGSNVLNIVRARKLISFKPMTGYRFAVHIKPILVLFAQTIVTSIYLNLDTVMLGFMQGNLEVGLYNAAIKVRTLLATVVASFGSVLLPRMSKIVQEKDTTQINILTQKTLDLTLFFAVPLSIYFSLFARECIVFLAGEEFLGATQAMQFVTIAVIPIGVTGVLGTQVLTALEKERLVLYSVIIGAVIDLILNIVLIPAYGASGAALATMVAEFFVLLAQVYYARNILKPIAKNLGVKYYIFAATTSTISSCLVMRWMNFESSFVSLCISAGIYFVVYASTLLIAKESVMFQCLDLVKSVMQKIFIRKSGK